MTEKQEAVQERGVPCFAELAEAAAKLLREAIERADPGDMKDIKQITGALKDLKELLEEESGGLGGIVIRIEGDPLDEG